MKKFSLINIGYDFEEGDVIEFEMPSFCSGDYEAVVMSDPKFGLYINQKDNYFEGLDYPIQGRDLLSWGIWSLIRESHRSSLRTKTD